jgi:hypothetical protein
MKHFIIQSNVDVTEIFSQEGRNLFFKTFLSNIKKKVFGKFNKDKKILQKLGIYSFEDVHC